MHTIQRPTTSTISPSSRSVSAIDMSLFNLSPSMDNRGSLPDPVAPGPLFLPFLPFPLLETAPSFSNNSGYPSSIPAFFKNAFTIAPHFVVGLTTSVMSFVNLERSTNFIFSPRSISDSASDSWVWLWKGGVEAAKLVLEPRDIPSSESMSIGSFDVPADVVARGRGGSGSMNMCFGWCAWIYSYVVFSYASGVFDVSVERDTKV